MVERDQWRHVRAVLAARTPDSELLVHRHGGEIVAVVGEVMTRVMVLRVPEGIPQARADADLDALSTLWNVAGELLDDADALAGAWAEVGRLRAALATIERDATTVLSLHRADPTGVVDIIRKTASAALTPEREGVGE